MANVSPAVSTFTGGVIGGLLQGRVDISSYPAGSERMENFWPLAQGPMTRRPGLEYIDSVEDSTQPAYLYPFVYSLDQSYLVVANNGNFRFYIDDGLLTIPGVVNGVVNGDFAGGITGWTDSSTGAGSATVISGRLWLDSDGASRAIAQQAVTVTQVNSLHILTFEVFHGPLNVRIGTTSGASDLMNYLDLRTGIHHLEFTPTQSTVYLQFWHTSNAGRVVDNVAMLSGSAFSIPHPYPDDILPELQFEQIGDVLYITHTDYITRRLERRGHRSWSLTKLLPDDGPFKDTNTTDITLSGSATSGEITLTASAALFTSGDQGNIFQLTGTGQVQTKAAASDDQYTDGIKVTGIGTSARQFRIDITGTFSATVTLQRSSGNENAYTDWQTYTSPTSVNIYDAQDNQTWFYRLGVKSGNYTSGTVTMTLTYSGGSSNGTVRIITVNSATAATAEVLDPLANTSTTTNWKRGAWNGDDGYPAAVTQGYGRLWFGRGLKLWGSVSDDFTSFESGSEDDRAMTFNVAAPTSDGIRSLAFVDHLCIFTQNTELLGSPNTSSEPVGPTNFKVEPKSFEGSKSRPPVTTSGSALFIHRTGRKLMQFTQNPRALSDTQYISVDLNRLATEICEDGIRKIAIQREPERRVYCVLQSGKVQVLLFRREEEIAAWSTIVTDGFVEDVQVVSQRDQDVVYFVVRRTVGGSAVRFIERLAPETVLNDWEFEHLDSALTLDLSYPSASLSASGYTGTITLIADSAVFSAADIGKTIWMAGGRVDVTAYTSTTILTGTVVNELDRDEDDIVQPVAPGRWGLGMEVTSVSGLQHLEGRTVRIYADMADAGTAVVTTGAVTLPWAASKVVVGLPYTSRWKSLKLAYGAQKGSALTMAKAAKGLGMLFHRCGEDAKFGGQFDSTMKPLVLRRAGQDAYSSGAKLASREEVLPFDARFSTDPRVCIRVEGPAPFSVLGYVPDIEEHDRA